MGASFVRRFTFDPGSTVLLNIESVNILDLQPPNPILGVGSGLALLFGEFEDGAFNTPIQVNSATGPTGLTGQLGALGYTYGGLASQYPCAVQRKADGAVAPEYWNGNGFVQLQGKQFAGLLCVRANTSVGAVTFTRLASITGAVGFTYGLAASQVLALDLGLGAGPVSATFTATAATVTGGGGVFGSITAGMTAVLGYDAAANFTVAFQAGDTTVAAAVARINQYAGFAFASVSGGQVALTGIQQGNGAQVRVVSGSTGCLTDLGLTAATTAGTGNVANIAAVTFSEVQSVVQTAIAGTKVEQDSSGHLRISNTATPSTGAITVGSATTATALGFSVGQQGTATGVAYLTGTSVTNPSLFAGGETLTLGWDSVPNIVVTFQVGDQTPAQVATRINAAAAAAGYPPGSSFVTVLGGGPSYLNFLGVAQGGQVRVVGASAGSVLTKLGLVVGTTQGTAQASGTLPAGTQVQVPGGALYVTMQTVVVTPTAIAGQAASGAGPYSVPVRFATDDGTGVGSGGGALTSVPLAPDVAAFSVTNPLPTTNALTEAQIDAAYVTAMNATLGMNGLAKTVNLAWSARQSNTVRTAGRNNAITASASLYGRMFVGRTPMNTSEAAALSNTAAPGVGAYRSDRYAHCWPNVSTFVPAIAARGVGGGAAFPASGNVDVGSDGFLVSICSQLNPEENPGQETAFAGAAIALETAFQAVDFQVADYQAAKLAGVAMPRFENGLMIFQSGVTSVDPTLYPSLAPIARRRMADFLQDSIGVFATTYGKRLSTVRRRAALAGAIRAFLRNLLSPGKEATQRIGGFKVDALTGNTPQLLAMGLFRIKVNVQTLPSMDGIVIETQIGNNVLDITESVPQALAA